MKEILGFQAYCPSKDKSGNPCGWVGVKRSGPLEALRDASKYLGESETRIGPASRVLHLPNIRPIFSK